MRTKPLSIHCIQHVSYETPGIISEWVRENGHRMTFTRLFMNEGFPEASPVDLLIILGGPMGTYEENEYSWLAVEKKFVRDCIDQQKAVLGICLGAQLVAECLGATVTKGPEPETGFWPVTVTEEAKSFGFLQNAEEFFPFHAHNDTFDLPKGAKLLASSEAYKNQAFAYGQKIFGMQFHLECTPPWISDLYRNSPPPLAGRFVQSPADVEKNLYRLAKNQRILYDVLDHLAAVSLSEDLLISGSL
jgi:GMP synthase-like glutamine amidotransferase